MTFCRKSAGYRLAGLRSVLIQQGMKQRDLTETELDEIGGLRDSNTLAEVLKTFARLPCFSEHPSADPVPS